MSGYFQRLLARSAQASATIHPLLRLPQFGLPQPHGDSAEFSAPAQRPEQGQPQQPHPQQPHPQQSRREQPQIFLASDEPSERESIPAEPAPLASASAAAAANFTQHAAPPPSQNSAWASISGLAQPAAPARGFEATPEHETPVHNPFAKASAKETAKENRDTSDETFHLMSPQAHARSADSAGLILPLALPLALPLTPAFSFAAPPDVTQARLQAAQLAIPTGQRAQPDKTEVHVSIGRIEITAWPTPAPVKRAAQSRSNTQSLDEYLSQRQQGRT